MWAVVVMVTGERNGLVRHHDPQTICTLLLCHGIVAWCDLCPLSRSRLHIHAAENDTGRCVDFDVRHLVYDLQCDLR